MSEWNGEGGRNKLANGEGDVGFKFCLFFFRTVLTIEQQDRANT